LAKNCYLIADKKKKKDFNLRDLVGVEKHSKDMLGKVERGRMSLKSGVNVYAAANIPTKA